MSKPLPPRPAAPAGSWLLVLSLVGVDYFSTLAYLPSIAVQAAGDWAPVAAGAVVAVTFLLALPVYWYVVGRASDGRGAAGLLESLIPGWRGKLLVLSLLGFAAADFVITRSLSLADATVHLIHNRHGQWLLDHSPVDVLTQRLEPWAPIQWLLRQILDPQVSITLVLSVASFGLWQLLRQGFSRRVLYVTAGVVSCYLALTALILASAIVYVTRHTVVWQSWHDAVFFTRPLNTPNTNWVWAWFSITLWSFPHMALGLSGFEMIMTVVPQVDDKNEQHGNATQKVRNTRKLMVVAVTIMAIYLSSAVMATTLLVPRDAIAPNGRAEHRALAYLAHGSPLSNGANGHELNPLFGELFGDIFDLSSVLILCMAGATVTVGLQNMLPHYLNRLGMDVTWAGKVGLILQVLNLIVLLVTVVFQASPSSQQWAYATSVLVLLSGAALAATTDLARRGTKRVLSRLPFLVQAAVATGFFLVMTGLTVLINQSGLLIAMAFVVAILISSIVSRWIRSTELRFEGFEFADESTLCRWNELCRSGPHVLAPHRPGRTPLTSKSTAMLRDYRLAPTTPVIFLEALLGDTSNFYQKPMMKIGREEGLEVIRLSQCVSVSHVLAAICLELCKNGSPPEIIFGWSEESPLAANLSFLVLGEGNIPWMVKELIRKSAPKDVNLPRVLVG